MCSSERCPRSKFRIKSKAKESPHSNYPYPPKSVKMKKFTSEFLYTDLYELFFVRHLAKLKIIYNFIKLIIIYHIFYNYL